MKKLFRKLKNLKKRTVLLWGCIFLAIFIIGVMFANHWFSTRGVPRVLRNVILEKISDKDYEFSASGIKCGIFSNIEIKNLKIIGKNNKSEIRAKKAYLKLNPTFSLGGIKLLESAQFAGCSVICKIDKSLRPVLNEKKLLLENFYISLKFKDNNIFLKPVVLNAFNTKLNLSGKFYNIDSILHNSQENIIEKYKDILSKIIIEKDVPREVNLDLVLDFADDKKNIINASFIAPKVGYDKFLFSKFNAKIIYQNNIITCQNVEIEQLEEEAMFDCIYNLQNKNLNFDGNINLNLKTIYPYIPKDYLKDIKISNSSKINSSIKLDSNLNDLKNSKIIADIKVENIEIKQQICEKIETKLNYKNNILDVQKLDINLPKGQNIGTQIVWNLKTGDFNTTFGASVKPDTILNYLPKDIKKYAQIATNDLSKIKTKGRILYNTNKNIDNASGKIELTVNDLMIDNIYLKKLNTSLKIDKDIIAFKDSNISIKSNSLNTLHLNGHWDNSDKKLFVDFESSIYLDQLQAILEQKKVTSPFKHNLEWTDNPFKLKGGISLELKDIANPKYQGELSFALPKFTYDDIAFQSAIGECYFNSDFLSISKLKISMSEKEYAIIRGTFDMKTKALSTTFDINADKDKILKLYSNEIIERINKKFKFPTTKLIKLNGALYKKSIYDNEFLGDFHLLTPKLKFNEGEINNADIHTIITGQTFTLKKVKFDLGNEDYCELSASIDLKNKTIKSKYKFNAHYDKILAFLEPEMIKKANDIFTLVDRPEYKVNIIGNFKKDSFDNSNFVTTATVKHPHGKFNKLDVYDLLAIVNVTQDELEILFKDEVGTWDDIKFKNGNAVLRYRSHYLELVDLKADAYGGVIELDYIFDEQDIKTMKLKFSDVQLVPLVTDQGWKIGDLKEGGDLTGKLNVVFGECPDDEVDMTGLGKVTLANANLWTNPIVAPFSQLLGKENTSGKISKVEADLNFKGDYVKVENLKTDGTMISMSGNGKYFLNTKKYKFDVKSTIMKERSIISKVLSPISWLMRAELIGKGDKVKWRKLTNIKNLFTGSKKEDE